MFTFWLVGFSVAGGLLVGLWLGQSEAIQERDRLRYDLRAAQFVQPEIVLEVVVSEDRRRWMRRFHSIEARKALAALQRAERLQSFSYRDMEQVLTRSEWMSFRDELIGARFLEWASDNRRAGTRWPARGLALLRAAGAC